jgi:hypothetical protein
MSLSTKNKYDCIINIQHILYNAEKREYLFRGI